MKRPLSLIPLVISICLTGTTATGQITVRNAKSDSPSSPQWLLDGVVETSWKSTVSGAQASFLLDDPILTDATYVLGEGPGEAAYRLLASSNYRDWTLLSEGLGYSMDQPGEITVFGQEEAQYLRFVSLTGEEVNWELITGLQLEVEDGILQLRPVNWGDISDPQVILGMVDRAFDWQVANETTRQDSTGWVNGAFYTGVGGLYTATGQEKYRQAILNKGAFTNWTLRLRTSNKTFYHADDHCLGQSWLELYLNDSNPSPVWIADVKNRIDRVMANPLQGRVDMNWCDALYMSPPNYGRLAAITGNDAYQTFIDGQWWDVSDLLYDTEFDLYYRDASYFDDREPNGSPVFWSRGNGWVIGGLVRMLQYMPLDWPARTSYTTQLEEMSGALASIQGDDGLWSSSLLYPEKYGYERETSGSAFFTYAMAWGINEGILDKATYGPVIEKAWAGLATMLNADGTIKFIQQVGAGPALNNGLYTDKDYGYGAFILAGIEMMRYYEASQPMMQFARMPTASVAVEQAEGSGWTTVEDFENGFGWGIQKDVNYTEAIIADPSDTAGSMVFSINTGFRTPGVYRATTALPAILEGSTATIYQRFSYDNPEVDVVFGISTQPLVDNYNDYESGFRIHYALTQPEARNGGSYVTIGDDFLQLSTWYEVWTVINNANDSYDVYIRGGSNYPEQTLLMSGIDFRNGTTNSISSYSMSYNTDYCEGNFYMDDIHIDSGGVNLSRPDGVRQPDYSPWSGIGRRQTNGVKSTPVGSLWDDTFPWIYHAEIGSWCYILPQDVYSGGYWAWQMTGNSWIWISRSWPGWYYDYGSENWLTYP